ncbi:MAG: DUF2842 domain-containing protein [Hyphomicrobiaceae bacterium]
MHIRVRKLIGAVALIVFLTIYALLAMVAAITLQVNASKWIEVIYYVVAGLAWTIPAGAIIWWMQRPGGPPSGAKDPQA